MPNRDGKYCATAIHGERSCKNHSFKPEVPVYVFISSKMVGVDRGQTFVSTAHKLCDSHGRQLL